MFGKYTITYEGSDGGGRRDRFRFNIGLGMGNFEGAG